MSPSTVCTSFPKSIKRHLPNFGFIVKVTEKHTKKYAECNEASWSWHLMSHCRFERWLSLESVSASAHVFPYLPSFLLSLQHLILTRPHKLHVEVCSSQCKQSINVSRLTWMTKKIYIYIPVHKTSATNKLEWKVALISSSVPLSWLGRAKFTPQWKPLKRSRGLKKN